MLVSTDQGASSNSTWSNTSASWLDTAVDSYHMCYIFLALFFKLRYVHHLHKTSQLDLSIVMVVHKCLLRQN